MCLPLPTLGRGNFKTIKTSQDHYEDHRYSCPRRRRSRFLPAAAAAADRAGDCCRGCKDQEVIEQK